MHAMTQPEAPSLPSLTIGSGALHVEGITGHGLARATVALRLDGQRVATDNLTREQLTGFALQLMELADELVDDRAYATSDSVKDGRGVLSQRHGDSLRRFYRLQDRLPILQLAQRVLESADDETATTLLTLLANVAATGEMPFRVDVAFKAANAPMLTLVQPSRNAAENTEEPA
jgi:hypothetical protein